MIIIFIDKGYVIYIYIYIYCIVIDIYKINAYLYLHILGFLGGKKYAIA